MTTKRRNRLNAGLIVSALLALAFDKLVLSENGTSTPSSAVASVAPQPRVATPAADAAPVEAAPIEPILRLDQVLADFEDFEPHRDPFKMSDLLREKVNARSQHADRDEVAEEQQRKTAHEFQSANSLQAVLNAGPNSLAIVNGLTVRLGQTIDGFALISVSQRSAIFQRHDLRIVLQIPLQ